MISKGTGFILKCSICDSPYKKSHHPYYCFVFNFAIYIIMLFVMITATMKNKKNKTGYNLFVKYSLNEFKYSIKHEK